MSISVYNQTFHLHNEQVSYIIQILDPGIAINLYYGKAIQNHGEFSHLNEWHQRACDVIIPGTGKYSREYLRSEYPCAFTGDMRMPALDILDASGSRITDFRYTGYEILDGKPKLKGLPACYGESREEAQTLKLYFADEVLKAELCLLYTIYTDRAVITRSAWIQNDSNQPFVIKGMMSFSLDLPDAQYEMLSLAGAWARERNICVSPLHPGLQSVYSLRGHSSHNFNPFLALKRPWTTEQQGEAYGFTILYSGNWQGSVDVDTFHTARISMGMHPLTMDWTLQPSESFQTPEAVLVYSDTGLNTMSQTFHSLLRERVARGVWKDQPRPILLNNWEGTYFDFNEQKILEMAAQARDLGIELFVLDDGWFKNRRDDYRALGDWVPDETKLPHGIVELSRKITEMGLKFGLWIEPEMISEDSDLYRSHPEYALQVPGRPKSTGRNQLVLDFANPEVVDTIYDMLVKVLDPADISYIKWDMNRSMSEVGSSVFPHESGSIYHRYILGVYSLYERLRERYPHILFESCAGGGGRFDPGMLYYAPQAWTSDDTDAVERLKIQYGTSMLYPICSMGSHVSAVPNHQLHRLTSLKMRADVAYFGTFGYELDPSSLNEAEKEEIRAQISFMKKYRSLIQFGTFCRLASPFEGNETAWMIVSADRKTAIVAYYQVLNRVNDRLLRIRLQGLDPGRLYQSDQLEYSAYGDELMSAGLIVRDDHFGHFGDFRSALYVLQAVQA